MILEEYPNYFVTYWGEVFNRNTGRSLKIQNNGGYQSVKLYNKGSWYRFSIHRLVAEQYVDKPEGKDHVNHIDGDPSNNHYSNLEWVTPQENSQHRCSVLLKGVGEKARNSKLTESKVILIRKLYERGSSVKELAKMYDIAPQNIHRVVKRQSWKHVA